MNKIGKEVFKQRCMNCGVIIGFSNNYEHEGVLCFNCYFNTDIEEDCDPRSDD